MAYTYKTALSAGETLRAILLSDADVAALVSTIVPIAVVAETRLPYIVYRRTSMETTPTKSGYRSSDQTQIEINCCAKSYDQSLKIAETVRHALESKVVCPDGVLCPRSIQMSDSEELYEGDAYIQSLTFKISI